MIDVAGQKDHARFTPFENPAVATALVGMDGRWLLLSQQFCDMLDYAPDELLYLTIGEITHPDDVDVDVTDTQRLVAGEITTYTTQKRYVRKDGSIICVKVTVSLALDNAEQPDYFISAVEDIANRQLADDAFRTLADTIPQLCWMADPEGYIVWYNRRWFEYTGKTMEDLWGQKWVPVLDAQSQRTTIDLWMSSIATGEPFEMVIPIMDRNQVARQFLTRIAPLHDDAGRVLRWFGTSTNIEGLKPAGKR